MNDKNIYTMPLLPLRGIIIFPYMALHLDATRKISVLALEEAMLKNQDIFLCAQTDPVIENPEFENFYEVGVVAKVKQLLRLPGDTVRVLVEGIQRAKMLNIVTNEPFLQCEVEKLEDIHGKKTSIELEALKRNVCELFEEYFSLNARLAPDTLLSITGLEELGQLTDIIAANLNVPIPKKMEFLKTLNIKKRLAKLEITLTRENDILRIQGKISRRVKEQIDKNQHDYLLREQIKAIQEELGDKEDVIFEVEEYKNKIAKANLPSEVLSKALKEVARLSKMPYGSHEATVVRNYLDNILELPWNAQTKVKFDLSHAKKILDDDHYGLTKIKDRILEYLSVASTKGSHKGTVLCFVGPPGVGKTSIAQSIAKSLNRKFARMSLGGVRDEADIRGHRKTYIGSMPGRIIQSLKLAKSKNPVILFDEIDKMSYDYRGDPASALLEVLDPEQNNSFTDHYLEVPFDLSDVFFITTANTLDTVPSPLIDRMEIIEVSGYTHVEKLNIAKKYLLRRQLFKNGVTSKKVSIGDDILETLINHYTYEAGVRGLEKMIGTLIRKAIKKMMLENLKNIKITDDVLNEFLGAYQYTHDNKRDKSEMGVATGLAWTSFGGEILTIEANVMEGSGKIELTGQLGDVMKESAIAAISYIRSKAELLNIDKNFYKDKDIHIHVPEGATPKDGPSAGITIATALISALTNMKVKNDIAMTGEITIRGRVLPIGGLKEKALAAHRAGIKTIIIPKENVKNLEDIPAELINDFHFIPVENMDEVIYNALDIVAESDQKNMSMYFEHQTPLGGNVPNIKC